MRIIIDCFKLVKGAGKSIGIYNLTMNLVKNLALSKDAMQDAGRIDAEIIVLGNQYNQKDFCYDGIHFLLIKNYNPLNKFHCVIWELFAVSVTCKKLKADRVLFPRGFCALTHPVKDIVITLDMIPFYYHENFPNYFNKIENAYIMNRLKASAKSCYRVITISEESKRQIIKYCGIGEEKIAVTYVGCNEIQIKCQNKCEDELEDLDYICAITSNLPHKNAKGIFLAYKKYCEMEEKPIDLVVIGVEDTKGIDFPAKIKEKIHCYKYVKDDNLLYQIIYHSRVFVFLSLAEGFGFPPLEAMQLGIPVICSDLSSLPEVVGNAAILVNPNEYEAIASEISRLLKDNALKEEMKKLSEVNVNRFLWANIVKEYWHYIVQ